MSSSVIAFSDSIHDERAAISEAYRVWLRQVLPAQCRDGSDQDGGFEDAQSSGWCDGRESAYNMARLAAARCWLCDSEDANRLDVAIRRGVKFLLRRQAPDGRLDLCGWFSANEAGFPLPGLVEAYKHLRQSAPALFHEIELDLRLFLQRAAQAVLAGSAYTANHRWAAACAPLAAVHSLWPDERYLAMVNDYLADGIDCDADGCWYEERSPGYNMVADHGLMAMADYLGRPELLQHVVQNLTFLLYQLNPNGEVDTTFSHRQDRAQANRPPCTYGVARRVAQLTGDGRFTTLAMAALQRTASLPYELMPLPFELANHPGPLPPPRPVPTTYEKFYPTRELARWRCGERALTLSADAGRHFFDGVLDQWGGRTPKRRLVSPALRRHRPAESAPGTCGYDGDSAALRAAGWPRCLGTFRPRRRLDAHAAFSAGLAADSDAMGPRAFHPGTLFNTRCSHTTGLRHAARTDCLVEPVVPTRRGDC